MIHFIIPFITTVIAVFIRESDSVRQSNTIPMLFLPLLAIFILVLAAGMLYNAQKGIIKDNSRFNKYKLSANNILIRLKLFKYNNDTNLILIIPYLLILFSSFLVTILYVVYACGVLQLKSLFESVWFGGALFILLPILILYYVIIRQIVLEDYKQEKPDFIINKKSKADSSSQTEE